MKNLTPADLETMEAVERQLSEASRHLIRHDEALRRAERRIADHFGLDDFQYDEPIHGSLFVGATDFLARLFFNEAARLVEKIKEEA